MFRLVQSLATTRSQIAKSSHELSGILARGFAAKRSPNKVIFLCEDCGAETNKWTGQCSACKAWNTMKEFRPAPELATPGGMSARLGGKPAGEPSGHRGWNTSGSALAAGGSGFGGGLVSLREFTEGLKSSLSK